jgi:hypothetical protein
MGLDASVMCSCYREGKTRPCPFPELFHIDADGFPALNIPYDNHEAMHEQFETWLAACCPHPYMDYLSLFVASWKGYRTFRDALEQLGWEHFPTLRAQLPDSNQGVMPTSAAAQALTELQYFREHSGNLPKAFLVDSETNQVISSSILSSADTDGLTNHTGIKMGYDENGFFIVDAWEMNRELFRAKRFEQRPLAAQIPDKPQQYEFLALDSERRFVCNTPLRIVREDEHSHLIQEYPRAMHIEQRPMSATSFNYILMPLTLVFETAVETGNPVRWS